MTDWTNSVLTGDVRTVRETAPAWPDDREHEGVQHDALDDAKHQARCVADCLRRQQAVADGGEGRC